MAMGELQQYIKDMEKYLEEIEEMHVTLQHKQIKVKEMEDGTEFLMD